MKKITVLLLLSASLKLKAQINITSTGQKGGITTGVIINNGIEQKDTTACMIFYFNKNKKINAVKGFVIMSLQNPPIYLNSKKKLFSLGKVQSVEINTVDHLQIGY